MTYITLLLPQAVLAGVEFLQGFLDFSVCSFSFDYLVKWGLVRKSVYRAHVYTKCVPHSDSCISTRVRGDTRCITLTISYAILGLDYPINRGLVSTSLYRMHVPSLCSPLLLWL